MNRVKYNILIPRQIFIGSETDAQDMVDIAGCSFIVDLREEADGPAFHGESTAWLPIGLNDHHDGQEQRLEEAVRTVAELYRSGHIIGIHCASGICRTAAVAAGVLMELGICRKLKEALEFVEISRKKTAIHPNLRKALDNLYDRRSY